MSWQLTLQFDMLQSKIAPVKRCMGFFKEGISPILNTDELKMMHYYASQRWQTRKNIEHKLGNT